MLLSFDQHGFSWKENLPVSTRSSQISVPPSSWAGILPVLAAEKPSRLGNREKPFSLSIEQIGPSSLSL
jgi:hypothetical protein